MLRLAVMLTNLQLEIHQKEMNQRGKEQSEFYIWGHLWHKSSDLFPEFEPVLQITR